MKNNIKHIIFDIDQTLLKPNGELQQGCTNLMKSVFESNIPVTFLSGKNMSEILNFFEMLCIECDIQKGLFHANFASNVGASTTINDGRQASKPITASAIKKIEEIVRNITKSSVIVYKTRTNNYMESLLDSKHRLKKFITASVVKALDEIGKVDFPITTKRREYLDVLLKDKQVLSLEIVCAHKSKDVAAAVSQAFPNLVVCEGDAVQVSCVGKKAYIEKFILNDDLKWENVCMLGDALNDREALLNAGYGILCNPKKKRVDITKEILSLQEKGQNKFITTNLGDKNIINYITNMEYNSQSLKKMSKEVLLELESTKKTK